MLLLSSNIYKHNLSFRYMIPEDSVLIVSDMQNYLIDQYTSEKLSQVVDHINTIIQDFRNAGAPIIFLKHVLSGQILPELDRKDTDIVVEKTWIDGFFKTDLDKRILGTQKSKVLCVGGQADECLRYTVVSGCEKLQGNQEKSPGNKPLQFYVADNAIITCDWESRRNALSTMNEAGARIISYTPYAKVGKQLEFLF